MKILTGIVLLGAALALSACGGDSDSSGSKSTETKSTPSKNQTTPEGGNAKVYNASTTNACEVNSKTNEVYATSKGCNFAHPTLQNGTPLNYKCVSDERVYGNQGGLNITAKTINLKAAGQSLTVLCKA